MVDYRNVHQSHDKDKQRRFYNAQTCLRKLRSFWEFDSVVDFGCGIGGWLAAAKSLDATVFRGFEGDWIRKTPTLIDQSCIEVVDLSVESPKLERRYDLCMSLEVAEHLPEKVAGRFCDDLTGASDFVLFSAAIPGQGGAGHVNEQFIDYWIELFWQRHYVPLDLIRPYIQNDKQIYWWLRQNMICFVRYDVLIERPSLLSRMAPLSSFGRIDPLIYQKKRDELTSLKKKLTA
jgi:hypothetical protein